MAQVCSAIRSLLRLVFDPGMIIIVIIIVMTNGNDDDHVNGSTYDRMVCVASGACHESQDVIREISI